MTQSKWESNRLKTMDPKTHELLYSIPDNADYAAEAGDLDAGDIPEARRSAVKELMFHSNDETERFLAAKLLASWGEHEGLVALQKSLERPEVIEGTYIHRLYGYDDTYRQVLMAVTMYFANVAGAQGKDVARLHVYELLSEIISLANDRPFEISELYFFVRREKYLEYLPMIEQHLISIIDFPEKHRWKIYDAIVFLMELDSDFVVPLLIGLNKTVDDFKP